MKSIKWLIKEILGMYSSKPTFFSKKRVESGISFMIAQFGMVYFLITHIDGLTMGELLLWATTEFAVSGYIINEIQKEKKLINFNSTEQNEDPNQGA